MTVNEVSKAEWVTPQTVRKWIQLKKLKAKITPTGYHVSQQDLEDFRKQHRPKISNMESLVEGGK